MTTTKTAEVLITHYQRDRMWERTRFWYETWRKTTMLFPLPEPWERLTAPVQISLCAVAQIAQEDGADREAYKARVNES